MSLKIEPLFSKEFETDEGIMEEQNQDASNGNAVKTTEAKYNFLQKSKGKSSKLKKPCSARTCNTQIFQCRQILPEQRSLMNSRFWIEMNPDQRLEYIIKNTQYTSEKSEAEKFAHTLTITGQQYFVCKKMFFSTLALVENHVKEMVVDYYENKKERLIKNSKPEKIKIKEEKKSTPLRRNPPKRSTNKKTENNKNVVKIEYVEVEAGNESCEGSNSENESFQKNIPKKRTRQSNTKKIKTEKKDTKKPIFKEIVSSSEPEEQEDSDQSWNEDSHIKSVTNSESEGSDIDEIKVLPVKTEKRPKRIPRKSTTIPIKKPKIEPLSEVENNNSTSEEEDNFSNVEDTDESEGEENHKTETESYSDKNKEYSNGVTIPKKVGPTCSSNLCPKIPTRNCKNIKEYQREHIFNEFWHKMSLSGRKFYVKQNVEIIKQAGRAKNITPLKYHLTIEKDKFEVCQRMFNATLALQSSCVHNWFYNSNPSEYDDIKNILDPLDTPKSLKARKRFENYAEKLQLLEDFLDSLDKLPPKSFYQQKTHKTYLTEHIEGLRNLQKIYKTTMKSEGIINPLPVKILKNVFCAKHYTFYTGYKKRHAKFKTVDDSEITPELEEIMKRDQQERQRDKILTKKLGSNIVVLDIDTYDGKVSPNWKGDGDEAEMNSRLSCFNLTVSNAITLHSYNYWFCEIDALDTTPSSFITCLMDYLTNFCVNAKQIIIYSRIGDARFKNIDMTNALVDYAVINKITVTQKFYIPRKHLYKDETECQSIYRSLYRKLRRFEINLPSDYISATIDCKREPTEAKWYNFNQFRDYSSKSKKHRYINLNDNIEIIEKIKSIICKQDGTVSIKMDFDDDWILLPSSYKCSPLEVSEWPQLYYDRRKISAIKYQLLQSLKVNLPKDCQFFYDYLTIEM